MGDLDNSSKLTTPNLNHAKMDDWLNVYEPAEDTFFMLDTLEEDMKFIIGMKPLTCVEIGSGAGAIITALGTKLGSATHCIATDVNKNACSLSASTAIHNNVNLDVVQGDLTSFFKGNSIDMIVFNPPYVVTPSEEVKGNNLLAKSWAGGSNGREVIDRFLKFLPQCLHQRSFGYILLLKENKPNEILTILKAEKFNCKIINFRRIRGEDLFIIRYMREPTDH